jgi:tetratricopeptide (TPR) repeat protein
MKNFRIFVIITLILVLSSFKYDNNEIDSILNSSKILLEKDALRSLELAEKALTYSNKNQYFKGIATATHLKGLIYVNWSMYDLALDFFYQSFVNYEKAKDTLASSKSLINIGVVFNDIRQYKTSLFFYNLAYNRIFLHRNDNNNPELIIAILNNIGVLYLQVNNIINAKKYFDEALNISKENKYDLGIGTTLSNIGKYYEERLLIDSAIVYLENAIEYFSKEEEYKYQKYTCILNLSRIYYKLSNIDEALENINLCLEYFTNTKNKLRLLSVYRLMIDIYNDKSLYDKSYFYFLKYINLNEEVFSNNMYEKVSAILIEYNSRQLQTEVTLLKEKILLKKKLQISLIISIIISFISVIFIIIYYRQKAIISEKKKELLEFENHKLIVEMQSNELNSLKDKANMQEVLLEKERKLSSTLLNIVNKSDTFKQISEFMAHQVRENKLDKNSEIYMQLNSIIKNSLKNDNVWKDFMIHYENINPNFFKNLSMKYPNLTDDDIKFSGYLMLNLSSKEMARLFSVSEKSVKMKKYRLRKKLAIPPNIKFSHFFSEI